MKLSPRLLTEHWELKLTAFGLAVLLWAAVQSDDMTRYTMREVPVDVRLSQSGWVAVDQPEPAEITVQFVGPVRELVRLAFAETRLVIPAEEVDDTLELYRPTAEWLEWEGRFDNLRVDEITPQGVRQRFQPIESRMVPVAVRLATVPPWVRLRSAPEAEPAQVEVEGRRDLVQALDTVYVNLLDVDAALGPAGARVMIDTAGLGLDVQPREVRIHMRPLADDSLAAPRSVSAGFL